MDGKRDDELNCPVCRGKFTLNEGKDTTLMEIYLYSITVSIVHVQKADTETNATCSL